jgi:PAS domain S-box-containing protein
MSEAPGADARLAALRRYEILDTLPEARLDDIAELARALFDAPIAVISLVDHHREWFKARLGLSIAETPLQHSFGAQVIRDAGVLATADARRDVRFRYNPVVAGEPQIRFYAGAPLRTGDGFILGTVAVMDPALRHDVNTQRVEMLARLANLAMREIEGEMLARIAGGILRQIEADPRIERLPRTEDPHRRIVEMANEGIWLLDADARTTYANPRAADMLQHCADEMIGRPIVEFMDAAARRQHEQNWMTCKAGARSRLEFRFRRRNGTELWTIVSLAPISDANGDFAGALAIVIDISHQKATERRLEEREAGLRRLFEENPNPMWVYDYETLTFLDVNQAAVERYGFSRGEFLAMQITDVRQAEGTTHAIPDLPMDRRGLRSGGERRHRTKAGDPIDVEALSSAVRFHGRDAVLEVVHDITERKRAEAALSQSEWLLRDAQRRAKLAYWFWDPATQAYTFADAYREVVGAESMEDVRTDEGFRRFVHEADREWVAAAFQRAKKKFAWQDIEYRVRRADGEVIWLREICEPELDEAGRPVRLIGIVQDVSDRKRAAEALRESEARLREAGRLARFGYWHWTARAPGTWDIGVSQYSPEGAAILGRDPAELDLGTVEYCERIVHPNDRDWMLRFCYDVSHGDETYKVEYRAVRPNGEVRNVLEFAENTYDASGLIVSTSGSIQDVTEHRRLEEQRLCLARLTQTAILRELSGVLSHELNQPLAAILGNAQAGNRLLAREPADLEEARSALEDIVAAERRAEGVIKRFGILLNKGAPTIRVLDLNAVVNDTLVIAQGDLIMRGITTNRRLAPSLPPVRGDSMQLQQVLLSLIVNAYEAMSDTHMAERTLTITTALADDRTVQIAVSDSGGAIAPGVLEKLFEPFVTTKTHSLGLGLTTCRSIVRAHGGQVWGLNNPDRGATFIVALLVSSKDRA